MKKVFALVLVLAALVSLSFAAPEDMIYRPRVENPVVNATLGQ